MLICKADFQNKKKLKQKANPVYNIFPFLTVTTSQNDFLENMKGKITNSKLQIHQLCMYVVKIKKVMSCIQGYKGDH